MKKNLIAPLLLILIFCQAGLASGPTAKMGTVLNSPGKITVIGQVDNTWVVLDVPDGKYKYFNVTRYKDGLTDGKTMKMDARWEGQPYYVTAACVGNKISIFYKSFSKGNYSGTPPIYMQNYDVTTLQPIGDAQLLYDKAKDGFTGTMVDIIYSDDHSKTLISIYGNEAKSKLMVFDKAGKKLYDKPFVFKAEEKKLVFHGFLLSNDGNIMAVAASADASWHWGYGIRNGAKVSYYFYTVDIKSGDGKTLKLTSPVSADTYTGDPVAGWLSNGNIAIAYGYYKTKTNAAVEGVHIAKYDPSFKMIAEKDIPADPAMVKQANEIEKASIDGFDHLKMNEIVPLEGDNFVLVTEYYFNKTTNQSSFEYCNYGITYRMNDKMDLVAADFIAKQQQGVPLMDFCFSFKSCHVGNDVYVLYNEDFKSKNEDGLQLYALHLPADGSKPASTKLLRTSDHFYTSIADMVEGSNGKVFANALLMKGFYTGNKSMKMVEVSLK